MSVEVTSNDKFDIKLVNDNFEAALYEDDDVNLFYYLESFEELNKFFTLMGTVFGFVSKDLKTKMDLLRELLRDSKEGEGNFLTAKKMIDYEKQNNLLYKNGYVSGSRTLLRIHRGLEFIQLFLKKLSDLKHEESTSFACKEAYEQTLAKHHPFIIRNGAKIAMYALPTKEVLLTRVCGEPANVERAIEHLPKTLEVSSVIFSRIENLYTVYDLHQLP